MNLRWRSCKRFTWLILMYCIFFYEVFRILLSRQTTTTKWETKRSAETSILPFCRPSKRELKIFLIKKNSLETCKFLFIWFERKIVHVSNWSCFSLQKVFVYQKETALRCRYIELLVRRYCMHRLIRLWIILTFEKTNLRHIRPSKLHKHSAKFGFGL